MGAIDFDPSAYVERERAAKPAKVAKVGTDKGLIDETLAELATLAGGAHPDIVAGLARLKTMPCPRFQDKAVWPVIVADALALATPDPIAGYSMADRAISLGWHPLDLFGFDPRWRSWDDWVSLSAWAQGRKVLVIGERTACLSSQEKTPGHFDRLSKRPRLEDIKFLWELK